jgi:flagellar assembly factor FliW
MTALLHFVTPPPGFEPHTEFALDPVEGAEGLFTLDAIDDAALRLFVLDPSLVMADYSPVISDEHVAELDLAAPADALLLVVAGRSAQGAQVNVLAPIVANATTGRAAQVILDGQDYPLRASLG